MQRKDRKHSGRVTPYPTIPIKLLKQENLFLNDFWDDWVDYRDGLKVSLDNKKIRSEHMWQADSLDVKRFNNKNKLLLQRRKAKKQMRVREVRPFPLDS
jgi:hypothetical protein